MAVRTRANGDGNGARRKVEMSTYQKTNAAAGSAQEGATVRYTAKTHTSGGRRGGVSGSDDGRLDAKFSAPGVLGTGTDPEELVAGGWPALLLCAMRVGV